MTIKELNKELNTLLDKKFKASNEDIKRIVELRAEISFRTVFNF